MSSMRFHAFTHKCPAHNLVLPNRVSCPECARVAREKLHSKNIAHVPQKVLETAREASRLMNCVLIRNEVYTLVHFIGQLCICPRTPEQRRLRRSQRKYQLRMLMKPGPTFGMDFALRAPMIQGLAADETVVARHYAKDDVEVTHRFHNNAFMRNVLEGAKAEFDRAYEGRSVESLKRNRGTQGIARRAEELLLFIEHSDQEVHNRFIKAVSRTSERLRKGLPVSPYYLWATFWEVTCFARSRYKTLNVDAKTFGDRACFAVNVALVEAFFLDMRMRFP